MCTLLTAAASLTHHLVSDSLAHRHTHTSLLQPPSDSCLAKVIDFIILGFISVITRDKKLCLFCQLSVQYKGVQTLWRNMKRFGLFG